MLKFTEENWVGGKAALETANRAFDAASKALHEQVTYLEDMADQWMISLADAINNNFDGSLEYKVIASKALVAMGLKPLNTDD